MGVNYYAKTAPKPTCPTCGHSNSISQLHIGKASLGWRFCFSIQTLPDGTALDDLGKWASYLLRPDVTITDEYGSTISRTELLNLIGSNQGGLPHGVNHEGYDWRYIDSGRYVQDGYGYDFRRGEFL